MIKPSDTATRAATRSAGFRSLTIHRRTAHQGIGLRDTSNDPGKMFFPPPEGCYCAPMNKKLCACRTKNRNQSKNSVPIPNDS